MLQIIAQTFDMAAPSLLEINLQHQIALACALAPVSLSHSLDVSHSIAQRAFLATGKSKSFEHVLCVTCHALLPHSADRCMVCGSLPRRRRRLEAVTESCSAKPLNAAAGDSKKIGDPTSQRSTPVNCTAPPRSIFAVCNLIQGDGPILSVPGTAAASSGSDTTLRDALPCAPQSTGALPASYKTPLFPQSEGPFVALSPQKLSMVPSVDITAEGEGALESKAARKRKRQLASGQLRSPEAAASSIPPSKAPSSGLLALLASSGLSTVGLTAAPSLHGKLLGGERMASKSLFSGTVAAAASATPGKRFSFSASK